MNIQKGSNGYGYVGYYAKIVTDKESSDGFYYEDEAKTTLLAYVGRDSIVTIPESVTAIGSSAFSGCSGIERIIIPNKVTSIDSEAFGNCSNLKSVTIGTGVLSIGSDAFRECPNLHKLIVLPNTNPSGMAEALRYSVSYTSYSTYQSVPDEGRITYVANNNYSGSSFGTLKVYDYLSSMFEVDGIVYVPVSPSERTCAAIDCTYDENVKNIAIGKTVNYRGVEMKVVEINPYLLIKNNHVESVNISAEVDIPKSCFSDCSTLATAKLAETIKEIGESAFNGCTNLSSINLPLELTTINRATFSGCSSLKNLTIPDKVEQINDYAFRNSGLCSIAIPASTTSIGNGVFYGCTSLESFEALDGSEFLNLGYNSYNGGLFFDCPLKTVKIGRNLEYDTSSNLGYSPFYRNTNIESVVFTDVPTEVFTNEFYGCTSLKEVSIGDGVTKIGNYAFSGCSALESFSFGKSLQEIGDEAFSDCTNMTKLYAEPTTPPTCGNQALDDINKWNCTLYVEQSAIGSYQAADQWKEFFFMGAHDFGNGSTPDTPVVPEIQTCAIPEIAVVNGALSIESATSGAVCHYTITTDDCKNGDVEAGNAIELSGQYNISAYATKSGMNDSEKVEAVLVWVNPAIEGDNIISMEAKKAVVIRRSGDDIVISGTEQGERIEVYSLGGVKLNSSVASDGETTIPCHAQKGEIVIVKYGEKAVKVKL